MILFLFFFAGSIAEYLIPSDASHKWMNFITDWLAKQTHMIDINQSENLRVRFQPIRRGHVIHIRKHTVWNIRCRLFHPLFFHKHLTYPILSNLGSTVPSKISMDFSAHSIPRVVTDTFTATDVYMVFEQLRVKHLGKNVRIFRSIWNFAKL